MLDGTSVAELEVEYGDLKIHIHRDAIWVRSQVAPPPSSATPQSETANSRDPAEAVVTATYVGEFRRSHDLPGVGDEVNLGTKLGEIEVLGIRNAVLASVDGVLSALLVEDEAPVEYGQPLAVIRPTAP